MLTTLRGSVIVAALSRSGTSSSFVFRFCARRAQKRNTDKKASTISPLRGLLERRQLSRDSLGPPMHAVLAARFRVELIEVGLLKLRAGWDDLLAGVVLDWAGKDIEARELALLHLCQRILDLLDHLGRQVGHALGRRLAFHEAMQPQAAAVGVEVVVAGLVTAGVDIGGDLRVDRAPVPVRRGQAALDLAA